MIGTRHYAGYLHNISQGGAKLRTITPIRKLGSVLLRLPDLPPLRCTLRWTDAYNAGVAFELAISHADLAEWAKSRSGQCELLAVCEIAEVEAVP
jgi:PilZ domain-containing protein